LPPLNSSSSADDESDDTTITGPAVSFDGMHEKHNESFFSFLVKFFLGLKEGNVSEAQAESMLRRKRRDAASNDVNSNE
jgi:hypothetical protein